MPRRNRVDPFGAIFATPARGLLMGNRGCLHDAEGRIVRRWTNRAWIACGLVFKGRRRDPAPPGRWTALFFLDEATALAAGHRPCGECRREDLARFKRALGMEAAQAAEIDRVLHAERTAEPRTWEAEAKSLPAGATISDRRGVPWIVLGARIARWTPAGYDLVRARPQGQVRVVTPPTVVRALAAGYAPTIHPTANARAESLDDSAN